MGAASLQDCSTAGVGFEPTSPLYDPVLTPSFSDGATPSDPRPRPRPRTDRVTMRLRATPSDPVLTPSPSSGATPSMSPGPLQGDRLIRGRGRGGADQGRCASAPRPHDDRAPHFTHAPKRNQPPRHARQRRSKVMRTSSAARRMRLSTFEVGPQPSPEPGSTDEIARAETPRAGEDVSA